MNIRRAQTTRGIRSMLTYWYRGVRYRPVLGLNLTVDQERESANRIDFYPGVMLRGARKSFEFFFFRATTIG